jgi:6,7-dimethyl-8-ribityllumazine synthase
MAREVKGNLVGAGMKVGVVVSRFNEVITRTLLDGCLDGLKRHGVSEDDVTVAWVPGALEIPVVARAMAGSGVVDAVVCLGAVIKGETAHFDYVAGGVASGASRASLDTGVPVIFGVLTTDTLEQAVNRAGGKAGNKGYEAAVAAIETADVLRKVRKLSGKGG